MVKHYNRANASKLFANNAELEWISLTALAPRGLAPLPMHRSSLPDGSDIILYAYVSPLGEVGATEIGTFLRNLHDQPPPMGLPDHKGFERILELCKHYKLECGLPDYRPKRAVLLHGDPVTPNILMSDRVLAIDWQCPALGDPCYDIAIALSSGMRVAYGYPPFSDLERTKFWCAYRDDDVKSQFDKVGPVYRQIIAAYLNARANTLDEKAARAELEQE